MLLRTCKFVCSNINESGYVSYDRKFCGTFWKMSGNLWWFKLNKMISWWFVKKLFVMVMCFDEVSLLRQNKSLMMSKKRRRSWDNVWFIFNDRICNWVSGWALSNKLAIRRVIDPPFVMIKGKDNSSFFFLVRLFTS